MYIVPSDLGPRERARLEGTRSLGDVDLLCLLLGTGTIGRPVAVVAAELLAATGGILGLAREGIRHHALDKLGIGEAKRARVEAAIELGHRAARLSALRESAVMAGPEQVAAWARAELSAAPHEELWILAVDAKHGLLAARRVAQGATQGCATGIKEILRVVLRTGGSSFLLVHNHPSGDPTPSVEDVRLTREVGRAAEIVGTPLLDHVIIAGERHQSLFAMGLLERPSERAG